MILITCKSPDSSVTTESGSIVDALNFVRSFAIAMSFEQDEDEAIEAAYLSEALAAETAREVVLRNLGPARPLYTFTFPNDTVITVRDV